MSDSNGRIIYTEAPSTTWEERREDYSSSHRSLASRSVPGPRRASARTVVNAFRSGCRTCRNRRRGKTLFTNRGCTACHTIGKGKSSGPDLLGVTERRTPEWLKQWIKAPESMLGSDSIANALLAEYKGVKMPNLHLSDADVDALISYLAQESQKKP